MAPEPSPLGKTSFLRESELFKDLSDDVLRAVLLQSTSRTLGTGDRIFEQGDPGDCLYVVKSGVVEITAKTPEGPTVLAYLGTGECIGEVALLTGSPRTATARVPERAELMILTKDVFDDLIMNFPILLRQLCVILARRLEHTIGKVPTSTNAPKQLTGSLKYFDLGLMLQTLVDSNQTGKMSLEIAAMPKSLRADVFFSAGSIVWAKMGRLYGAEAVYQLFQMELDGTFHFSGAATDRTPEPNVFDSSISLLLESARLHDELGQLKRRLPDPARVFRHKVPQLHWTDLDSVDVASDVWHRLDGGAPLQKLVDTASHCSAKVYDVVWQMLSAGQIS
jgi:CRP-like cAMP-binding protein